MEIENFNQDAFDHVVGRLDRILSCMIFWAKKTDLDVPNKQTLKHHAEDMILAGEKILREIKGENMTIREHPEDAQPGDEIHAAKLVEMYLKEHPEEEPNRDALTAYANRIGMLKRKWNESSNYRCTKCGATFGGYYLNKNKMTVCGRIHWTEPPCDGELVLHKTEP